MITRIKAENFRCLRSIDVRLRSFQILVGPNGSGKSALMDALAFIRTLTAEYLNPAISERTENFHDLVWGREGNRFSLSLEVTAPGESAIDGNGGAARFARYEVAIRADVAEEVVQIEKEKVEIHRAGATLELLVAERVGAESTYFYESKTSQPMKVQIERIYSVLGRAPIGPENFPEAGWLRDALRGDGSGVCPVELRTDDLRAPSPPFKGTVKSLTGSHLARFVAELMDKSPEAFTDWIKHLRTCLPDLETIRTILRPEDRHRYLMVRFKNGIEVPSWVLSEGELRLMALTILAYMPDTGRIYLIEEPENGLHPTAIEAIYQSLSSVYGGQVLVATHSPILLSLAKPDELLCFAKTPGGSRIVRGDEHPVLKEWKGEVNISDLFAAGVLG
jgi:predicted ATPase